MNEMNSKSKKITTTVIVLSIILSGFFLYSKIQANKEIKQEKIKNEHLLSEKLRLNESVANLKKDLNSLYGKNNQLDKLVVENRKKIEDKETEIRRLSKENASVSDLKKKNIELETLRQKLIKDISDLNLSLNDLKNENNSLTKSLADLKTENEMLATNNEILRALAADNYLVEAQKGKSEKTTIYARNTKKLSISFDLPNNPGNDMSFKIVTPSGEELSSKDNKSAFIRVADNKDNLVASNNYIGSINSKRIEMIYKPETKLKKGIYKVKIYNNNEYVGSTQLKLR